MRKTLLALLTLLLAGCATYHGDIQDNFSKPAAVGDTSQKVPLTVRLVADQGVRNLSVSQTAGFTYDVKYGSALISAVENELATAFRTVTRVESAVPVGDPNTVFVFIAFRADLIAAGKAMLDYKIDLNVKNADLTSRIGSYSYSGREDYSVPGSVERALLNGVTFSLLLPVIGTMENEAQGTAMEASLRKAIARAAREMRDAMVADVGLRQFAARPPPAKASSKKKSRAESLPPQVADVVPPPASFPPPAQASPPPPPVLRFAEQPVVPRFPRGSERPDDVAVIIGNADYSRLGRDIPDVKPAHADAEGARLYAAQALGIKDGNIILLKDATGSQMTRVFGSKDNHQGQLFDWVKPGKSRVFVYYSGHGAPGGQGGSPYLIPTDADAARIELNGYPLKQLYDNLGKLPAASVTVVLEACFSGISPAGSVLSSASPVFFDVKAPPVPANLTVITAGAANQMASWETDGASSLFTKYYLKGMAGAADSDRDGRVGLDELERYLKETLTYFARRHYGRDQNAQIVKGGGS